VHDALRSLGVPPQRLHYDGRADTEPLKVVGSKLAAAHSGRIEITLLAGR
jgi:flagellar motor protein MotB